MRIPRVTRALVIVSALLTLALLPFAGGCGPGSEGADGAKNAAAPLRVAVSVPPQKYFVERIVGDLVQVTIMVKPGTEPHTYEPKPADLQELSEAAAYFTIGLPFESMWMNRFRSAAPHMEVVDTVAGIERIPLPEYTHDEETDGHGDDELDTHIWTSPTLVKLQAEIIAATLTRLDPAHGAVYEQNLTAFLSDIEQLEADIRSTLAGHEGAKFIVYHPAWGYFARDFGLIQIPVEIEGREPSAAALAALIRETREEGIAVIFVQPEFSARAAETLAREIGGSVVPISPLEEDWLANMRRVADSLAAAFGQDR